MPVRAPQLGEQVLRSLWPEPAVVGERLGSLIAEYRAVPSAADPRFLLPVGRRSSAGALRHFRSGGTASSRGRMAVLRGCLQFTGGWPMVRDRFAVSGPPEGTAGTIESELCRLLGEPVVLGIHLGPMRANRKPILQVLDIAGSPLGFGKLGVDRLTRALVRAEYGALDVLAGRQLGPVRAPRSVHCADWNDATLLLMEHLPLAGATAVPDRARIAAMCSVARAGQVYHCPFVDSPAYSRLAASVEDIPQPDVRAGVARALHLLAGRTEPWEIGSWHGDWTTWNCARDSDRILVWDWERFQDGVPVGWDALHHALRQDLEGRPPSPAVARDLLAAAPAILAPFGVPDEDAEDVARAYLIALAIRYSVDRQRDAGGRSGRVEDWILPIVAEQGVP